MKARLLAELRHWDERANTLGTQEGAGGCSVGICGGVDGGCGQAHGAEKSLAAQGTTWEARKAVFDKAVAGGLTSTPGGSRTAATQRPKLFFGSVKVDAARNSRDVATMANEVLQHLASLPHNEVTLTLEIRAQVPGGVPDNLVRTVSENCRTLKFKSQGFETA